MKILDRKFLDVPTPSAHAATIAFYKGHPVFSWFGGTREGMQDVSIYIYNLNNDNEHILIGDKDSIPRWNPILVNIEDNLILFEKAGAFCDRWQTFIHNISSWTNDITKKEIIETATVLPSGLNGPVKSCPIIINNKLFCGSSVETFYDWTSYIESYWIKTSDPKDMIFGSRTAPLVVKEKKTYSDSLSGKTGITMGIIQPTLWVTNYKYGYDIDATIHAFFRSSKGLEKIYYSENLIGDSEHDGDDHWITPIPTNLDNPNSAVDVVFHNDRLFLVHNPDKTHRAPLVVSEIKLNSIGEIAKFDVIDQIVISEKVDENFPCISKELSYPYMIENDGKLHLVYTNARTRIEYVTIEV